MDQDEKLRLLYVACTRARDHLLVSRPPQRGREGLLREDALDRERSADPMLWEQVEEPSDRRCPPRPDRPRPDRTTLRPQCARPRRRGGPSAARCWRAARVHAFSATAVKRAAAAGREIDADEDRAEEPVGVQVPGCGSGARVAAGKGRDGLREGRARSAPGRRPRDRRRRRRRWRAPRPSPKDSPAGRPRSRRRSGRSSPRRSCARRRPRRSSGRCTWPRRSATVWWRATSTCSCAAGRPGGGRLQDRSRGHRRRARHPGRVLPTAARGLRRGDRGGHGGAGRAGVLVFVGARDPIEAVERAFGRSELGVEAVPALVTDLR